MRHKRILSLLLCVAVMLGMLVFPTAASEYNNQKIVTTTTGADVKLFKMGTNYFVHKVYTPLETVDNGDGTSTHYFSANGNLSYRVSMEGKITKAGYLSDDTAYAVYTDDDAQPTDRIDYTEAGTNASTVADDSVLLNVNSQNHLSLSVGDTKTLKAYRAWQIIDSHLNHIIEPDFNFTVLTGEDVVSLEPYPEQPTVNGSGNWRTVTAIGEGTAVIEVTYDAIDIVGGSYSGIYGATDPARTGIVVITVGEDTPNVDFGIECRSGTGSVDYSTAEKNAWDAEFDTLYFIGDSGEMTLSPTVSDGTISDVAVSNDKGETWTSLAAEDGTYTAPITSGNNIIRVITDIGEAYQVVRGDELELVISNITNPNKTISAGDTVRVQLVGLHTPIPKFAGTYNPGYLGNTDGSSGVHLSYTFCGETVTSTPTQYDFATLGNTIEITIPADESELTLTDGYIGLGVIGVSGFCEGGDSHRNIPDSGSTTRNVVTTFTTRSILPNIPLSAGMVPSDNTAPFVRSDAPSEAQISEGKTYAVSLSKIFSDPEGDDMTYTVKIDGGKAKEADAYFTFTPKSEGTYTLTFTANDGIADSEEYTVILTVTEAEEDEPASSESDYGIDDSDIAGYVKISFVDKGERVKGEKNVTYPKAIGTIIRTKKVPFEDGDTVADVTLRLLDALGYSYNYAGTTKDGFYLSSIGGFTVGGIEYDSLGEFDAGSGSGWMVTLNGDFIEYGASDFEVEDGDVIKWQYSCQTGADIGDIYAEDEEEEDEDTDEETDEETQDEKINVYTNSTYTDVPKDAWYYEAVKYAYENGFMVGTENMFHPDEYVTRAMLVTVLYRLDGEHKAETKITFKDVAPDAWYADAVAWALGSGIVYGVSESEFAPDTNITREQFAAVLYRYASALGFDTQSTAAIDRYEDADEISEYACKAISWTVAKGIIGGTSEFTLSPKDGAVRSQCAAILMRFCESVE